MINAFLLLAYINNPPPQFWSFRIAYPSGYYVNLIRKQLTKILHKSSSSTAFISLYEGVGLSVKMLRTTPLSSLI